LLVAKKEPQEVVKIPQIEERIVDTMTQEEPSKEGRKRTREDDRLV